MKKKFTKSDQERYNFNLELMASIGSKAIDESRHFNKDERKFLDEIEQQQDTIRLRYMTEKEMWGI